MKKIELFRIRFRRNVPTEQGALCGWIIQQKVWYGWANVNSVIYNDIKPALEKLLSIRNGFSALGISTLQAN